MLATSSGARATLLFWRDVLINHAPNTPVFRLRDNVTCGEGAFMPPDRSYLAFCGNSDIDSFLAALQAFGVQIVETAPPPGLLPMGDFNNRLTSSDVAAFWGTTKALAATVDAALNRRGSSVLGWIVGAAAAALSIGLLVRAMRTREKD